MAFGDPSPGFTAQQLTDWAESNAKGAYQDALEELDRLMIVYDVSVDLLLATATDNMLRNFRRFLQEKARGAQQLQCPQAGTPDQEAGEEGCHEGSVPAVG